MTGIAQADLKSVTCSHDEDQCTKCHGGGVAPNLTVGKAYGDLTGLDLFDTDNPEKSILYLEISKGGHAYSYTSDSTRAMILKWIRQGAKDN